MDRKEFIKTCGLACLGGTALAVFLQSCVNPRYFAENTSTSSFITVRKKEFIQMVKDKKVERKYVLLKSEKFDFPICVFKLSEENYSALLMECTHKGCELHNQGEFLVCPCHGSEFSNKGVVQNPPADQNLKTFSVKTDIDHIYVYF